MAQKSETAKNSVEQLLQLMRALRSPQGGCPWDLKQNLESLVPYTLEEAYEVADAIAQKDKDGLKKELGDLMFQVVFYAQLCDEDGDFDFYDVVDAVVDKLLRRHPHVFPDGTLASAGTRSGQIDSDEVKLSWERIKQQERTEKAQTGLLDDIPRALPALQRAEKLQKRVAHYGFDWPDIEAVMEKVKEELAELEEAIASQQQKEIEQELGDLMFTLINLSRHLRHSPETALRATNEKFERRWCFIERELLNQNTELKDANPELLELLWIKAKAKNI